MDLAGSCAPCLISDDGYIRVPHTWWEDNAIKPIRHMIKKKKSINSDITRIRGSKIELKYGHNNIKKDAKNLDCSTFIHK